LRIFKNVFYIIEKAHLKRRSAMESYKGLSPSQFFYRNREIAGFSNPVRSLYQAVRELLENSLDATETHGILPNITLEIRPHTNNNQSDKVTIRIEDNGIGIPIAEVPNVFARVFYGSKYVLRQARGVFGLGVKMAVLYAQITTATPIYVKSSTIDSETEYEYKLFIDIERNLPIILQLNVFKKKKKWHGTIVELTIQGNWSQARRRIKEYIRRTALIAPYATIRLITPENSVEYKRVSRKLPEPPQIGKYHPRGVDIELLKMLIRAADKKLTLVDFLSKYFDGVGKKTALNFCKWAEFNPNHKIKRLTLSDLEKLANKMHQYDKWRRPKPLTLSPLGDTLLREGVRRILEPEFVTAISRPPSSYSGNPFIIETALAWGGKVPVSDSPLLLRFANRIPLLYDESVDVSRKIIDSIDWSIYKVKFPAPLAIITHICSTKIPFKGVGKEAIAEVPEVEKELNIAIRETARRLRRHISRIEKIYEIKRKEVTITKYMDEVARALSYIVNDDDSEEIIKKKLMKLLKKEIGKKGIVTGEMKNVAKAKTPRG